MAPHGLPVLALGLYAAKGIDRLTCRLSSDLELKNVVLEEIKNAKRERSRTPTKIIINRGRWDVTWLVDRPDSLYLLQFEKVSLFGAQDDEGIA